MELHSTTRRGNLAATDWVVSTAAFYGITGFTLALFRLVAEGTRFRCWNKFLMSIAGMAKVVGCCRSTAEKALKKLRDLGVIVYDGQKPSGKGRQFVKYRLAGTPECPLPEWVVQAREQDRERLAEQVPEWEPEQDPEVPLTCTFTYGSKPTFGPVTEESSSEAPVSHSSHQRLRVGINPSALPMKTRPKAGQEPSGSARREPHLGLSPVWGGAKADRGTIRRVARDVARRLVGVAAPRRVGGAGGVREEVSPAVCQPGNDLPVNAKIAVTYSPRTTEGAAMTPFTDPALGVLPLDIRLFYLGLRSLADTASMIIADTRYLKAELFRYDDNITPTHISNWINTLADNGKIHVIPGHLLLSDPNTETPNDGALFAFPAPKPLKQNPEQDFETFWHYYPRRTGKGAARKAFLAAVSKGTPAHRIIEAATLYANTCQMIGKEIQFTPHPSVWLNQERWDDDQEQAPQVRSRADDAFQQNMMMVERYRQQEGLTGGTAPKEIGPGW